MQNHSSEKTKNQFGPREGEWEYESSTNNI